MKVGSKFITGDFLSGMMFLDPKELIVVEHMKNFETFKFDGYRFYSRTKFSNIENEIMEGYHFSSIYLGVQLLITLNKKRTNLFIDVIESDIIRVQHEFNSTETIGSEVEFALMEYENNKTINSMSQKNSFIKIITEIAKAF